MSSRLRQTQLARRDLEVFDAVRTLDNFQRELPNFFPAPLSASVRRSRDRQRHDAATASV